MKEFEVRSAFEAENGVRNSRQNAPTTQFVRAVSVGSLNGIRFRKKIVSGKGFVKARFS
jgi:hypothetical protein